MVFEEKHTTKLPTNNVVFCMVQSPFTFCIVKVVRLYKIYSIKSVQQLRCNLSLSLSLPAIHLVFILWLPPFGAVAGNRGCKFLLRKKNSFNFEIDLNYSFFSFSSFWPSHLAIFAFLFYALEIHTLQKFHGMETKHGHIVANGWICEQMRI